MSEEKIPGNAPATEEDNSNEIETNKPTDNYYSVDDPKKEFSTTIGDGEMHNEGLVGDGSIPDEPLFSEGSTSEQNEAENHDSEG